VTTQKTKAETRARAMAKLLEEAGFKIRVQVEHKAPEYFSDGDVMSGARVLVIVHADKPNEWDDSYSFTFESHETCKYGRAGTRFIGAHLYRRYGKFHSKRLSLKQLRFRIGMEMDSAHYARQHANEEV
jgi:hypothetical protein